jgi:hypothetical protein
VGEAGKHFISLGELSKIDYFRNSQNKQRDEPLIMSWHDACKHNIIEELRVVL